MAFIPRILSIKSKFGLLFSLFLALSPFKRRRLYRAIGSEIVYFLFSYKTIKRGSLKKLLNAGDFYYNFSYREIRSPSNENFRIYCSPGGANSDGPTPRHFGIVIDGFSISFNMSYEFKPSSYSLQDEEVAQVSYERDGVMTLPIEGVTRYWFDKYTFHKSDGPDKEELELHKLMCESFRKISEGPYSDMNPNPPPMEPHEDFAFNITSDSLDIDNEQFRNRYEQKAILDIFKLAMTAFPAHFSVEPKTFRMEERQCQSSKFLDCKYGAKVKFSDKFLVDVKNNTLIKPSFNWNKILKILNYKP